MHHLGMAEKQQRERTTRRASVHRLPVAVQDKDRAIKGYNHVASRGEMQVRVTSRPILAKLEKQRFFAQSISA